jgi:lysophospholipase L1-like esterase
VRVVFLGDSLTEGVDGVSYLRLLRERIQRDERLRDVELINAGVGGDTVVNLLRRVPADVVPQRPDWVVVFVGGNDCMTALLHRSLPTPRTRRGLRYWRDEKGIREAVTPDRFRDGMRALVDTLTTRTSARVALCTPATMGESPRVRRWRWLDRYAEVTRLVSAERGCDLIDVRAAFVCAVADLPPRLPLSWVRAPLVRFVAAGDWERMAALRGLRLTYDGVHMTERGAALIGDTMGAWLRQAVKVQAPAANQ